MKRIVLIGSLLLVLALTAGTASAGIILGPGWPLLPPIITPDTSPPGYYPYPYGYSYSYPYPYGYYSYPYRYYGPRVWGPRYWGYGGWGRGRVPGYRWYHR